MSSNITLNSAITAYLRVDRAPRTNRNYGYCLRSMAREIGGGRSLNLITFEDLLDYTHRLHNEVKQVTFAQYVTVIRQFFNWCVARSYISTSPATGIVARRIKSRSPNRNRPIPPEVLTAMLNATLAIPRDHAIIMFLADTGCRVGAVSRLKISSIDFEIGMAVVHEKGDRYYHAYFGQNTTNALRRWLEVRPRVDHDYVFTRKKPPYTPVGTTSITMMIRTLGERLTGMRYTAHGIRHAVGHALAHRGVPVTVTQQKLGHLSPQTTIDRYYPHEYTPQLMEVSRTHSLAATRSVDEDIKLTDNPKIIKLKSR